MNAASNLELLQIFVERAPVAVAMFDREMRYLLASQQWCDRHQLQSIEIIGQSYYERCPDLSEKSHIHLQRALSGEFTRWEEAEFDSNAVQWVKWKAQPWTNSSEEIAGLIVYQEAIAQSLTLVECDRWLIEGIRDYGLILLDPDGYILSWNLGAKRIQGFSATEQIGKSFSSLYALEEIQRNYPQEHLTTAATYSHCEAESWWMCKDGKQFRANLILTAIRDERKQLRGFALAIRDVTAERQAEKYLRLLERAIAASGNGITISDATQPDNPLIYINPRFEQLTGYTVSDVIGYNCRFLQGEERDQPALEQLRTAIKTGNECSVVLRNYRKDGTLFWNELHIAPVRDDTGKLTHFIGIQSDITERKQAEAALRQSEILRQSEAKNRALIQAIPDAIFRINRDGTYIDVKVEKGFSQQPLSQSIEQVFPPAIANEHLHYAHQALQTGEIQIFEYELLVDSEPYNYEVRLVVDGSNEVLAIVRNITERKKIERLKNEFVSIVSHELRTPLTSVRGALSLMTGGVVGELPPQAKAMVDIAYKNSERLILLINDILDIEKIESGKMDFHLKLMELVPLVEQAIEANRSFGDQFGVKFVLESSIADARVNVDRDRLLQVLTNLLSNAAKFSPPNDTVTITVSRHCPVVRQEENPWQNSQAIRCVYTPQSFIRVAVSDRGAGIPEHFRSHIFQKFAQADTSDTRRQAGTGLGLSICKAIVEKLNGEMGFETEVNVGTTFYFDLPEYEGVSPSLSVSNTPIQGQQVLICEDDRDIAKLLSLMLQQAGFVTDIAYNAAEAKQLLAQNYYAAMTVDLALPDQSGIALIRELREQEQTRSLPIVVVSAKAQQGRKELESSGFAVVDWLSKPIDQAQLMSAVSQAVRLQANSKPRILHVEDDYDLTQVIFAILQDMAELDTATNLQEAKFKLEQQTYDLVILDLSLPDGSGLELLPHLNAESGYPIPALVFSAREISGNIAHQVTAALVKSRTSNQQLLDTINSLIGRSSQD